MNCKVLQWLGPWQHRQDRVALIFTKFRGITHKDNIRHILPNRRSAILDLRMQWLTNLTYNHGLKHPIFFFEQWRLWYTEVIMWPMWLFLYVGSVVWTNYINKRKRSEPDMSLRRTFLFLFSFFFYNFRTGQLDCKCSTCSTRKGETHVF